MNKKIFATMLIGALATTSAHAEYNSGEIVIQGVVPGTWELTVYDINSGYDFDLTEQGTAATPISARVGTIHIQSNERETVEGRLFVSSLNGGTLDNNSSLPGLADSDLRYQVTLSINALGTITGTPAGPIVPATPLPTDILIGTPFDLVSQKSLGFASGTMGEVTYDVTVTLPDPTDPEEGTFPDASGVYTDTITFTIMDDL